MNAQSPELTDHQHEVQSFVDEAVGLVMQRLQEQARGDQNAAAACPDSDAALAVGGRLAHLLGPFAERRDLDVDHLVCQFLNDQLPRVIEACDADAARYPEQDPALEDLDEVFYASNGFWATVAYRLANALLRLGVPVLPRAVSCVAHSRTGVDIHPAATIAPGLFIDHGTGIAIGCTATIGENVNLYNGVVLGTRSKPRKKTDQASGEVTKRHPTIGRGVSLYTNAFVGGDVTVGEGSVIGAYAYLNRDVPPGSVEAGRTDSKNETDAPAAEAAPTTTRSVVDMIGNTPMYEITNIPFNPKVRIFAKLEGWNPSGSIKDRLAKSLIESGEASGALTHDKIILESTSGNTGIGLAMVGAAKGYEVVLTMSSAMSEERKQVLRAFGATLIETAPDKGTGGAIAHARQMVKDEPGKYWVANQHASADNPKVHYEETAAEILQQVPDVTHLVAGIGTFGTLRGAGARLREEVNAEVVGLEPIYGKPIQGLRNMGEPFAPELYDPELLDRKISTPPGPAMQMTRELALKEGLFVGMSSGAALWGAIEVANSIEQGTIVVIFPDRGEKYLSTPLFEQPAPEPAEKPTPTPTVAVTPGKESWSYAI